MLLYPTRIKSIIVILVLLILSAGSLYAQSNSAINSLNDYSFNLYKQLALGNKNVFFSPLSTYLALSMAYEGSKGETKKEFKNTLHLSRNSKSSDFINIINGPKSRGNSSFILSNAVWVMRKYPIEDRYKNVIQRNYSAHVFSINFSKKDSAAAQINNWVLKSTKGLIRNMIEPSNIDNQTKIVITSSVYFDGRWNEEFDKNQTKKGKFYTARDDTTPTDFMNKTEYLNYYENKQLQFVSIPYKGKQLSFCIILPAESISIDSIENHLCPSFLDSLLRDMSYSKVKISVPKFKMETSYSLKKSLNSLGLQLAFTKKANFSGISKRRELLINSIKHKAYIDVNEEKTRAAATSIVSMISGSKTQINEKPKVFIANHPFIFIILIMKTKGIIFIGKFAYPEKI